MRVALCTAALAFAGCGGNDDEPGPSGTATQAATPAETPTATPTAESEVEATAVLLERLEGAGYSVSQAEAGTGTPVSIGALSLPLDGGGQVAVYVYATPEDADAAAEQFDSVEDANPDQIDVETEGPNVYVGTVEEPAKLPEAEFEKVIAAAEGR